MRDELAMREKGEVALNHSAVDVELAVTPAYCVGVHSNVLPAPVASVPQERTPALFAFTSQFAALSAETVRLVVEARVEVSMVVEAYGKVLAVPEVTVIAPVESIVVVAVPPKYAFWNTDSCEDEALAEKSWSADHVLAAESEAP